MYVELPGPVQKSKIEYFVIFRNSMGMINNRADTRLIGEMRLSGLPVGESCILVAFTKKDGVFYHSRSEFSVEKNKSVTTDFNQVSEEKLKEMFGENVRI